MIDEAYTTLEDEFDIANEWIFEFLLEEEAFLNKKNKIESLLSLSEESQITLVDIESSTDSVIDSILLLLKSDLDNEQMSKEEYDEKVKEFTSDTYKEETIKKFSEPKEHMLFEAAIAGAETLSALFDKPTKSFNFFLKRADDAFQETEGFKLSDKLAALRTGLLAEIDQTKTIDLAINVVKKINTKKNLKKFGLHGKKEQDDYSTCCDELLINLEKIKTTI